METLNEHILEIRYKPNPKILDYRGTWAKVISEHMGLEHWKIVENRFDVYDDDNTMHAFVGFRNAGFSVRNTQTKNFFSDKTIRLFRYLFSLEGFGDSLYVHRLGVRSKFAQEYKGEFEELLKKYTQNFFSLSDKANKAINAELLDIGGPMDFKDAIGNFHIRSGPIKSEQLGDFLNRNELLPEVSLFLDIDYWTKPDTILDSRRVLRKIKSLSEAVWEKFDTLSSVILGE